MSAGPTAMVPGGLFAALRPLDPASPASAAWRALGAGACVPNPFYEADYALPAARAWPVTVLPETAESGLAVLSTCWMIWE